VNDAIREALGTHVDWLRTLRWISTAERVLPIVCGVLLLLALVIPAAFGHFNAAWPAAIGHALLLLAAAYLAPRWLSSAGLALVALSILNFTILSFSPAGGLAWLGIIIGGLGLVSLPFTALSHLRLRRRWQAVGGYASRDDFRWLLTQAPLILRWQVRRALADVAGAGHGAGGSADHC